MQKKSQEQFDRSLTQFRTLSNEKLELENELIKVYESLKHKTMTSENLKTITSLRERINSVNNELKKTDKKILKMLSAT